jgi:hypothetical protein
MWRNKSCRSFNSGMESINEHFAVRLNELIDRIEASESNRDEALESIGETLMEAVAEEAPKFVAALRQTAGAMNRSHRRYWRKFESKIRIHWGDAFDQFYSVLAFARESSQYYSIELEKGEVDEVDLVTEALISLQARACRIAGEVHALLQAGYGYGALARCRTLHEIAVIAYILVDYGRKVEHHDLAERFFEHDKVMRYEEAVEFQNHCEELGFDPFSDEQIAEWKEENDRLIHRYGRAYRMDYGWAVSVAASPTFRNLEEKVEMSHFRTYYKSASKEIHSSIRSLGANRVEFRGSTIDLSGPTNVMLSDPGQLAISSLLQVTTALLFEGRKEGPLPTDFLLVQALSALIESARQAFINVGSRN